jgi:hypothetical protein
MLMLEYCNQTVRLFFILILMKIINTEIKIIKDEKNFYIALS